MTVTSMFSVVRETMYIAQEHKKAIEKQSIEAVTKCSPPPHVVLKENLREQLPQLKLTKVSLNRRQNKKFIIPGAGQGRAGRGAAEGK